jgi:hypothetical protein
MMNHVIDRFHAIRLPWIISYNIPYSPKHHWLRMANPLVELWQLILFREMRTNSLDSSLKTLLQVWYVYYANHLQKATGINSNCRFSARVDSSCDSRIEAFYFPLPPNMAVVFRDQGHSKNSSVVFVRYERRTCSTSAYEETL